MEVRVFAALKSRCVLHDQKQVETVPKRSHQRKPVKASQAGSCPVGEAGLRSLKSQRAGCGDADSTCLLEQETRLAGRG